MKHLTTTVLAAMLAVCAPSAAAQAPAANAAPQAPLPDAKAAEADLRVLIAEQQSGKPLSDRLTEQFASLVRTDSGRYRKILHSFGPPGAIRLDEQVGRTFNFIADHPVGEVKWTLMYDRDSDRIYNVAWQLLIDPTLTAAMERWRGLAQLPGHNWKSWLLDNTGNHLYVDTCWWAKVAVRIECDRAFPNGETKRIAYTLSDRGAVLTGAFKEPVTFEWQHDGTSVSGREYVVGDRSIDRTYYSPQMLTTDVSSKWFNGRIVAIRDSFPGQADRIHAQVDADYKAAKAQQEAAALAAQRATQAGGSSGYRTVTMEEALAHIQAEVDAENAEFEAHIESMGGYGSSSGNPGADILGGFMKGLGEATAQNEAMRQSMDNARNRGLAEGAAEYARREAARSREEAAQRQADIEHARRVREQEEAARQARLAATRAEEARRVASVGQPAPQAATGKPGVAAAAAAVKPLRFVLMIGMRNLPGDRNNSVCYSNVITRPGPPGWGARGFLPSGSAEQALQQINAMKDGFIAACRRKGREITGEGNFTHRWNQSDRDEQDVQAARPRVPEDLSVVLN